MSIAFTPVITETLIHAKVTRDFKRGRLERKAGQLLCSPNRESVVWASTEMEPGTEVTCQKCRKMLGMEPSE